MLEKFENIKIRIPKTRSLSGQSDRTNGLVLVLFLAFILSILHWKEASKSNSNY